MFTLTYLMYYVVLNNIFFLTVARRFCFINFTSVLFESLMFCTTIMQLLLKRRILLLLKGSDVLHN